MDKPFTILYNYFEKHQRAFFAFFIASFLLVGYFAFQIKLEEDISKIIPHDEKIERLNDVFQNSKFVDRLVFTVSQKDTNTTANPDSLVIFAEEFAQKVDKKLKPYLSNTNYKVDDDVAMTMFSGISEHLPIYLNEQDYKAIDTLILPETVKKTLQRNYRTLTSPAGIALKNIISADPVGVSMLGIKKLQQLQYDENFELYDGYVVSKNHKHLLMFVTPAFPSNNTGKNELLLNGLANIIDSLSQNRQILASYFGATVVAVGNALQIRRDAQLTQGATIIFLILFIGFYFRKKRAPILILVPVLFGALFSVAMLYFLKGQVSVIALATGSVILGIAVNYSLHVFNHYRHTNDIRTVIKDLAMPLTVGSFTTIGGFLCLQFVKSEMLKDLGLFAAFALIGAALASLIFLPQLIKFREDKTKFIIERNSLIDKISSYNLEHNKWVIWGIFLLTIVFGYTSQNVSFESDMMNMNFMSKKTKKAETELNRLNAFSLRSVYVVSYGKNLDAALQQNEKTLATIENLKKQQIISKYSGVSSFIISDSLQKQRIKRWNEYWTIEKKQNLLAVLEKEGAELKFNKSAFEPFRTLINTNFQVADKSKTNELRKSFLDDYITEKPNQTTVVTLLKVDAKNAPKVYAAFENDKNVTILDKQYITNKLVEIIQSDFYQIAWMTSILVFVVLLITYGRIELALISFVPMFITWIWILGIMAIFQIQFNIVNIIISALIFGLGDDYSLFIMDGLLQEYKTGKKNLSSYKSSILLSGITTISGLGVLIFAQHPALKSIAIISMVGILCVVIISQILIPFLFHLLITKRTNQGKFPWTLTNFIKSFFAYFYFFIGCLLLTVFGTFFTKIYPFNKEKGLYYYHIIMQKFAGSLVYIMANVKKNIVNSLNEDFSKPAVVICNHQSVLDILTTIMLNPKIILLTNNWVWSSPFFGYVVRMADFYRVDDGAENSIELISKRVKMGYSLVVFPEGTRSYDGTIKRFHKGAFYLAEKLNLDILPIVIHGTGYTMAKSDFMLNNGTMTLKFLPRIKPNDPNFGVDYAENTKLIGRYFKEKYQELKTEMERPNFLREKLVYNYIYKGPILEWYMKIKTKLEKNYQLFDDLLPKEGKILDIGCGYGFMTYMLNFAAPKREVTGIDYDEEKIETAQHCFSKNEHTNFEYADVLTYNFEKYNAIILSDILHYLQPEQQRIVVEKCINAINFNGKVIIRDGNKDLEERHKGTKLSEFFSTKLVSFNKTTENGLSFLSGKLIKQIAEENHLNYQEIDNTKYTSNVIFVLEKVKKQHL